ncbi:nuclear transport factor 2 family protein [Tolypothrix campylonemoides VB511288]|nr:nuclear transport factor 2 family protein [Tolypothrix campylonemoides VB511288]
MRRSFAAIVALLVAGIAAAATGVTSRVGADVEAAFQAVQAAVERRDGATLRAIVHPDFEMLHALGQIDSRDAWLALVDTGRLPRQTTERHEAEIAIRVVGDTAVRGSVLRMRDRARGRDMWLRGTATFVRVEGRWLLLRQQSTLLHDGPLADPPDAAAYAGRYDIPQRDGFAIEPADGYLRLRWSNGATLPLITMGDDRFAAGPDSTLAFARDADGRVVSATRSGPEGAWWTATRAADAPTR